MGAKEKGAKEMGWKMTGTKEGDGSEEEGNEGIRSEGDNQETGRKGVTSMGEKEMDNMLPGDMTAGQNITKGIRCKSHSEVVMRRKARVFVGDSIVRKTDRVLNEGTTW